MNTRHTSDKNGNKNHDEENFRQYEANHGLVRGKSVPDEEIRDVESEDLRDDEASEDVAGEAEITPEDLQALGPKDLSLDLGEDEALKHRPHPVDFGAKDLDIPGTDDDDDMENIGSEDEENNFYSLGGDTAGESEDENPDVVE